MVGGGGEIKRQQQSRIPVKAVKALTQRAAEQPFQAAPQRAAVKTRDLGEVPVAITTMFFTTEENEDTHRQAPFDPAISGTQGRQSFTGFKSIKFWIQLVHLNLPTARPYYLHEYSPRKSPASRTTSMGRKCCSNSSSKLEL